MRVIFDLGEDSTISTTPEKLSLVNLPDGKGVAVSFAGTVLLRFEGVTAVSTKTAQVEPLQAPVPTEILPSQD